MLPDEGEHLTTGWEDDLAPTDSLVRQTSPHERHRPFTPWVTQHRPQWRLVAQ